MRVNVPNKARDPEPRRRCRRCGLVNEPGAKVCATCKVKLGPQPRRKSS